MEWLLVFCAGGLILAYLGAYIMVELEIIDRIKDHITKKLSH